MVKYTCMLLYRLKQVLLSGNSWFFHVCPHMGSNYFLINDTSAKTNMPFPGVVYSDFLL